MKNSKYLFIVFFLLIGKVSFSQIVNFTDSSFKSLLLLANVDNPLALNLNGERTVVDLNKDGEIQVAEAAQISTLSLDCGSGGPCNVTWPLTSLEGIKSFTNLKSLDCGYNRISDLNLSGMKSLININCQSNLSTSLNLDGCTNLKTLDCSYNQITSLNVNGCSNLVSMRCSNNRIGSLDVSGCSYLGSLNCSENQITSLNVSGLLYLNFLTANNNLISNLNIDVCPNLIDLSLHYNNLSTLNLTNLSVLQNVSVYNNYKLNSLNLSGCISLTNLNCSSTILNTLHVSDCINLNFLSCRDSQLTYINLKNGHTESGLDFQNNPNLHLICCDQTELGMVQYLVDAYSLHYTCQISTTNCPSLNIQNFDPDKADIYPNPAHDYIRFNKCIKTVSVFSLDGKLITTKLENNEVDLSHFSEGIYIVRITNENDIIVMKKFIKN